MSQDIFSQFKPEVRESVDGLIWLGYLEDSCELGGHKFTYRTLYGDEELYASLVTKEYVDTLGIDKAFAWAHVALSLTSVDGDTNFCPALGPDKLEFARARFRYVTSKWFWPVGNFLFVKYGELVQKQVDAMEGIQNLSKGSPHRSLPFVDSLIDPGASKESL